MENAKVKGLCDVTLLLVVVSLTSFDLTTNYLSAALKGCEQCCILCSVCLSESQAIFGKDVDGIFNSKFLKLIVFRCSRMMHIVQ